MRLRAVAFGKGEWADELTAAAGPLSETILLGNLAVWADGKKIEWDAKNLKATNAPEVEHIIMMCLAKQPSGRPADAATLAKLLGAVPQSGDWSEEEALGWWTEFRKLERPSAATADTRTITVDIAGREDIAG